MTPMKRIVLTAKQIKTLPGAYTRKSSEQLQGMVAGLLYEAGLRNYFVGMKDGRDMMLFEMVLDTDQSDVKRVVHFKVEIPQIYQKMQKAPDRPMPHVGWRLFYDYLDRKMAMVRLGATDIIEEFTASIVMRLPDREVTIAELIQESARNPDQPLLPIIQMRETEEV